MARKKKDDGVNRTSASEKGRPSDTGRNKAAIKGVNDLNDPELQKDTPETGSVTGMDELSNDVLKGSHRNRNTDKPQLDKPDYA